LGDLKAHPKNPNTHPERQVELLAKVITATGWRSPVVVSKLSGYVIKGHGRLLAAARAGFEEVPVDLQDYESEEEELADMIVDNDIADLAVMDLDLRGAVLADLAAMDYPMELVDFSEFDADEIGLPDLPEGDGPGICTMSFKLTENQVEEVEQALRLAKGDGPFGETGNENGNGNALARLARKYNDG